MPLKDYNTTGKLVEYLKRPRMCPGTPVGNLAERFFKVLCKIHFKYLPTILTSHNIVTVAVEKAANNVKNSTKSIWQI